MLITAGADVLKLAEGSMGRSLGLGRFIPPGSESRARTQEGSPGTWEVRRFPSQHPGAGEPGEQPPRPALACSAASGAKHEHSGGKASATTKKCWQTRRRKSELLVVPLKPGNRPTGPGGGKGQSGVETVGGQHDGYTGTR
jgi:hypothetical protein